MPWRDGSVIDERLEFVRLLGRRLVDLGWGVSQPATVTGILRR